MRGSGIGALRAAALLLGAGCQDYFVGGELDGAGSGEAPSLDTPRKVDTIVQTTPVEVDILWVVDNSCSMQDKQNILANNFPAFIDMFVDSELDWHVGVVSTDVEAADHNGKLQPSKSGTRFLDPTTTGIEQQFDEMVRLGTTGSASEVGLTASYRAITQPTVQHQTVNADFYREQAALHIIVVSDEEDQSAYYGAGAVGPNEYIDWLSQLKSSDDIPVTFSSIVKFTDAPCFPSDLGTTAGTRYRNVTAAIGGIESDICLGDWTDVLTALGEQASGRKREFFLSEVPVPGSIDLTVESRRKKRFGVDLDSLRGKRTVAAACGKRFGDDATCFPFTYDATRNSIHIEPDGDDDWLPNPRDHVVIDYALLSGLQQSTEEQDDSDAAED